MNEDNVTHEPATHVHKHRFIIFLVAAISIAIFLVFVALQLYQSSGTVQLDLSRPGFDDVRKELTKDTEVFEGFPSSGAIDTNTLVQFEEMYKKELEQATAIDAFSGDALSDKALLIPSN